MSEQPRGLPCVPCSKMKVAHACYTERLVDGVPTCIFCEDSVACPYIKSLVKKKTLPVVTKSKTRKKNG